MTLHQSPPPKQPKQTRVPSKDLEGLTAEGIPDGGVNLIIICDQGVGG